MTRPAGRPSKWPPSPTTPLGRMVASTTRFDGESDAMTESLKFYLDGQNVIAEYDDADVIQRRYVHGTQRIDERAVLLVGAGEELDSYYYLLQELDTVTGLMNEFGALIEAYTYDAYGQVRMWGYSGWDFNRDGDTDADEDPETLDDFSTWVGYFGTYLPGHSMADSNMDCYVDGFDFAYMSNHVQPAEVPLRVSGVGNPYFFTGRRLHFLERLDGDPGTEPTFNRTVQYNRARHYSPAHGRWLQRDPVGQAVLFFFARSGQPIALYPGTAASWTLRMNLGTQNLYEYALSAALTLSDPFGLFTQADCLAFWKSVFGGWATVRTARANLLTSRESLQKQWGKIINDENIPADERRKIRSEIEKQLKDIADKEGKFTPYINDGFEIAALANWMVKEGCKCDAARMASVAFKNNDTFRDTFDQFNKIPSGLTPDQIAVWLMNNAFSKNQPGKGIWEMAKRIGYQNILRQAQKDCCADELIEPRPPRPLNAFDLYLERPTINSLGTIKDKLRKVYE